MGTIWKNEIFKGSSAIPRQNTIRKYALNLKTSKQLGTWKKIIWDFVKNLNIRPSHGALNYEAALQASQHSDKIGNQYSLNIHQKLSRGEGRRQLVGGAGALASSHVVVALVRLPSDSSDTVGWLGYCFFFFRHPNFSPNIDNIYIIFGLSRKKWIPVKNITAIALGEEVEKKTKQGTSEWTRRNKYQIPKRGHQISFLTF